MDNEVSLNLTVKVDVELLKKIDDVVEVFKISREDYFSNVIHHWCERANEPPQKLTLTNQQVEEICNSHAEEQRDALRLLRLTLDETLVSLKDAMDIVEEIRFGEIEIKPLAKDEKTV